MSEAQPGAVGQVPGQPGQAAPQQGQPGRSRRCDGRSPQSIDPAVSPSTQASLSPAVFGQRALAMSGGVSNAG
jgi:hypothetical protein